VRAQKHDYNREIHAVWKKTATGYSGDVVVPMAFFALQNFVEGQQFGLSFEVQKVLPATGPTGSQGRIVFSSKGNGPFEIDPESPTTLQQIKLLGPLQGPELGR
jgi:hypothetical protein